MQKCVHNMGDEKRRNRKWWLNGDIWRLAGSKEQETIVVAEKAKRETCVHAIY